MLPQTILFLQSKHMRIELKGENSFPMSRTTFDTERILVLLVSARKLFGSHNREEKESSWNIGAASLTKPAWQSYLMGLIPRKVLLGLQP